MTKKEIEKVKKEIDRINSNMSWHLQARWEEHHNDIIQALEELDDQQD